MTCRVENFFASLYRITSSFNFFGEGPSAFLSTVLLAEVISINSVVILIKSIQEII